MPMPIPEDLAQSIARAVSAAPGEGVYVLDRHRRIVHWNGDAERLTGYSASEVTGRACHENLLGHTDLSGTPLCFGICPVALTMLDGNQRSIEIILERKDGSRLNVIARIAPLTDDEGNILGAVEVFTESPQRTPAP